MTIPHDHNKAYYYECNEGIKELKKCPAEQFYNLGTEDCDYPVSDKRRRVPFVVSEAEKARR